MKSLDRLHAWHRIFRYRWKAERVEMDFLLGRKISGGTVLDVGANRGVWSYWLHHTFPNSKIVAFEPQPELVRYLADFKAAFRLGRLSIVPLGLSSSDGVRKMRRPLQHWAAATMEDQMERLGEIELIHVPVISLDAYLARHPELRPVRLVKCDVEGHEADFLAGAERTLREDRPALLVEWSMPDLAERQRLFSLMTALNYRVMQFQRGRLVPCTGAARHCKPCWDLGANYVFLPREGREPYRVVSGKRSRNLYHALTASLLRRQAMRRVPA